MIVSNTTPLSNLLHLGVLERLGGLFDRVLIPDGVFRELVSGHGPRSSWQAAEEFGFLEIRPVTGNWKLLRHLESTLDQGEAEAICLALDVEASLLLVDDQDARAAARVQELAVAGTLGVLVRLRRAGLVGPLEPLLVRLRQDFHFWFTDELGHWALREADR